MENYGKYDEFGNPLWQSTLDYPPNPELILQRERDIQSISNVTSTYIKQSKDSLEKKVVPQLLSSLYSIKEYLKDGKDPNDIPSLKEIHEALQLKQKLALTQEQYLKKFKDGFYINPKEGTIRYFDSNEIKYKNTRKVVPIPGTELLVFPVEHTTVNGTYRIYTVQLPAPDTKMNNDPNTIICHELIGYTEIPQMGIGIDEMDAYVIAFGSGMIPLSKVDHYDKWCTKAQQQFAANGTVPNFNDKVYLMSDNTSDITYDPYQTGTYTPLIPCKGVYSRQVIKKKKPKIFS